MIVSPPVLMIVTDPGIPDLDARLADALRGGPAWVQYRDKASSTEERIEWLLRFRSHHPENPLLVNEDLMAAERSGADGVHLSSLSSHPGHVWVCTPRLVRFTLGEDAIIGRSAHPWNLTEPEAFGSHLDYIAFGTVFHSESHPGGDCTGIAGLRYACEEARRRGRNLPILAIGGITEQNAGSCVLAGAAGVAVIRGVLMADDPARAVAAIHAEMREAADERRKGAT